MMILLIRFLMTTSMSSIPIQWLPSALLCFFLLPLLPSYSLYGASLTIYLHLKCLLWSLSFNLLLLFPVKWKLREDCYLGKTIPLRSPFSLSLTHAVVNSRHSPIFFLSSINIPITRCPPYDQRRLKQLRFHLRPIPTRRRSLLSLLLGLFCALNFSTVYALPGHTHALVPESSLDASRQLSLARIVTAAPSRHIDETTHPPNPPVPPQPPLLSVPHCCLLDTDSFPAVLDTGANRFIVNDAKLLRNFRPANGGVKGVGGTSVPLHGIGFFDLPLLSDAGDSDVLTVDAVYVPSSPFNLIPPQLLFEVMTTAQFQVDRFSHSNTDYVFQYRPPNKPPRTLTVPIDSRGLFTLWSTPGYTAFFSQAAAFNSDFTSFAGHPTSPSPDSDDLPSVPHSILFNHDPAKPIPPTPLDAIQLKQHRLAVLHERLGHLSFSRLKLMARAGLIPRDLASVDPPTCPGCAYGKAHRKPWRTKGPSNHGRLRTATAPGQVISVDQLVSPTPGFVPTHLGRPTLSRYIGATVFVDHFSDFTYAHLMTSLDAASTVAAKLAFERCLSQYHVTAHHYHADNGLFSSKLFRDSIHTAGQTLSFCGVNAHHQNGKAEARIKDVTEGARTALLHASHRWPKAVDVSLWPAALKNYINLRNSLPRDFIPQQKRGQLATYDGSPLSKLSGVSIEPNLRDFHPFGCPVYVLKEALQKHQSHNKWQDRSRVGIFLSHSPEHASSVPLVLNSQTGLVSPQFHCVFDDAFDTCRRDSSFESLWQFKAKLHLAAPTTTYTFSPLDPLCTPTATTIPDPITHVPLFVHPWDSVPSPPSIPTPIPPPINLPVAPIPLPTPPIIPPPAPNPVIDLPTSRAGRRITPNRKYFNENMIQSTVAFLNTFSPEPSTTLFELLQPLPPFDPHPLAFAIDAIHCHSASADPDVMTFDEAMASPDRIQFIAAMQKELLDHIGRGHWKIVPLSSIPPGKRPIPMVWSMKCKRDPLGTVIKWKARLCAGGHRSLANVDYWDTYSPVVSWSTVRLMLIFALINDWHMESIDFVLAFPQAPIKTDIFMTPPRVPHNFKIPDLPSYSARASNVYKLVKNLYGLKDAGRTWNEFLHHGLLRRGWKPSSIDPCLYTKPNIALVIYVDDACLMSPNKSLIATEILSLQKEFQLTSEGILKDYLGTRFTRNPDGSLTLTQPRMVRRILNLVGLDPTSSNTKLHDTPACDRDLLDQDPLGQPHTYSWNYRAVVGSLSYLQAMIRPDLTMSVQQCARFCNDPQQQHAQALKRICRYLLKTHELGLTFRPNPTRGLECYVDADWAGSWKMRSSHDPLSARSRTGFVIMYAGCPIVWGSKMQTLVALSTTEAEYIALSSSLREVIALMNLMTELTSRGFRLNKDTPKVHCTVFEDNRSCIEVATNHRTRPRTKHLSVRLHHFHAHILAKTITIQHISTKQQIADLFTKPLARDQFARLRDQFMGWGSLAVRE